MGSAQDDAATWANAVAALYNNVHYLGAIAGMAGQRKVQVVQTVVAEDGTTLFRKGEQIGENLLELLGNTRLSAPLDAHLSVCTPVDVPTLLAEMSRQLAEAPLGLLIAAELGTETAMFGRALQQMNWPHQASFQMAVMRDQLPSLYEHSVLMVLVALYLATRSGWDERQCAKVAAAAFLHDIGMLYMSTSWTDSEYKLTDRERAQLAAHSITGSTVVRSMRAYPASVEDAVLEHHECMDGSGYPRQLQDFAISPMGRMLMVAEVVSGFYGKYADTAGERLSLTLRMHSQRFPAEFVGPVLSMLQRGAASVVTAPREVVLADCQTLATVMQYWASCQRVLPAQWPAQPGGRAMLFVHNRLRALETSMAEAGAHTRQRSDWEQLLDHDSRSAQELSLVYREALWQLESCIDNCLRRWPSLQAEDGSIVERALWTWVQSSRKALAAGAATVARLLAEATPREVPTAVPVLNNAARVQPEPSPATATGLSEVVVLTPPALAPVGLQAPATQTMEPASP